MWWKTSGIMPWVMMNEIWQSFLPLFRGRVKPGVTGGKVETCFHITIAKKNVCATITLDYKLETVEFIKIGGDFYDANFQTVSIHNLRCGFDLVACVLWNVLA